MSINSSLITLTLMLCIDTDAVALLVVNVVCFTLLMLTCPWLNMPLKQPFFLCSPFLCVPDICMLYRECSEMLSIFLSFCMHFDLLTYCYSNSPTALKTCL